MFVKIFDTRKQQRRETNGSTTTVAMLWKLYCISKNACRLNSASQKRWESLQFYPVDHPSVIDGSAYRLNTIVYLEGYKEPYRLDVTSNSGGILVYVNEQFRSKIVTSLSIPGDIQTIPIEINLRNKKWLLLPIYRPPAQNEAYSIEKIQKLYDCASITYKNSLIFGDFNMDQSSTTLSSFVENNGLYSMIKTPTCFMSATNPRFIDLMLTNMKHSFF